MTRSGFAPARTFAPVVALALALSGCAALKPSPEPIAPPEQEPVAEAFALPWPDPEHGHQMSLRDRQRADAIARLDLMIDEDDAIRGADQGLPGRRFDNIWDRIRAGFAMPPLDTQLVEQKERFYLGKPDMLQRMMTRGGRYLFHIVEEIEKRGLPTELALLPFVESAMNPTALSTAQASGLWQFIPSTGRAYNLQQDWWVDNRRDVVKSTQAALDYLQKIYEMQGNDWFLALASYNWGEGAVARAIKLNRARNRPADYLSLNMPNETRHYVPKLIALKNILLRADEIGLLLPPLPNRPYFVTIEKTRPIDLKLAAEFAGMTVEEFLELNPAHNRPVIAASRNNEIKLPADRLDGFLEATERHIASGRPFATWQPYTLKSGESLEAVAARSGISVAELRQANGVRPAARPIVGTRILVPGQQVADDRKIEDFQGSRIVEIAEQRAAWHAVGRGDTMASIAQRNRLTVPQLRKLNPAVQGEPAQGTRLLLRQGTTQAIVTTENGVRTVSASAPPATPAGTGAATPAPVAAAPPKTATPAATAATSPKTAAPAATASAAPKKAAPAAAPPGPIAQTGAPAKTASPGNNRKAQPTEAKARQSPDASASVSTPKAAPSRTDGPKAAGPAAAQPARSAATAGGPAPPESSRQPSAATYPGNAQPRRASTAPPENPPPGPARPVDRST